MINYMATSSFCLFNYVQVNISDNFANFYQYYAAILVKKLNTMYSSIIEIVINMSEKNNTKQQQRSSFRNYQYLFIAAAIATAIAGIVHLYMPLTHTRMLANIPTATFFLASGILQIFWVLPMIKRWGRIWYYIGIAGNVGFIILYVVTRFPGNPVNGRGGDVDAVDMICELAQVAYIAITAVILAKERSIKIVDKEQLR
jgi:uncharacterized membrane protein HdeD (DUF308 family)